MSSKKALEKTKVGIAFAVLSFLGFADATYLTVQHFRGLSPNCSVLQGCEIVTTSRYATIFGVPIALLGSIYYLTLIILLAFYFDKKDKKILEKISLITFAGAIFSFWLLFLQLAVIHAICIYCTFSAFTSITLALVGLYTLSKFGHVKFAKPPKRFHKDFNYILGVARIGLGFLFFWGFLDKLPNWLKGVSPTKGFLMSSSGMFSSAFHSLVGTPAVDWLFMIGLFCIGISLMLGIGMKIATSTGMLLVALMFLSLFPPAHNPLIDEHIFYFLLLWLFKLNDSGKYFGFGKDWTRTPLVKRYPILA